MFFSTPSHRCLPGCRLPRKTRSWTYESKCHSINGLLGWYAPGRGKTRRLLMVVCLHNNPHYALLHVLVQVLGAGEPPRETRGRRYDCIYHSCSKGLRCCVIGRGAPASGVVLWWRWSLERWPSKSTRRGRLCGKNSPTAPRSLPFIPMPTRDDLSFAAAMRLYGFERACTEGSCTTQKLNMTKC